MAREMELWRPFREIDRFRREFDDLFNRVLRGGVSELTPRGIATPAIESFIEGGKFKVRADLPGIDPKDVEVTVTGRMLTLRGKREESHEEKGRNFFHREVSYGAFERAIELPEGVSSSDIKASYKNGVLELTAPVAKEAEPRKVPVQADDDGSKR
jgi:HSP20 family protein